MLVKRQLEDLQIENEFEALEWGDLLFIDSSHVVKPYGDTLLELLVILPRLKKGVIVHIHDIYLPHDYPYDTKNFDRTTVWTEQWLV